MKEKTKICKKVDAKGITLIALIITIIVMLILVGVTISVALNGGLISKAQEAKTKTGEAQIQERDLLTGRIKIGDTWYDSLDEYLKGNPSEDQSDEPSKWGQDKNGNITYDGEKSELKVGDYVDYEKYVKSNGDKTSEINSLYEELTKYSGYTGNTYGTEYPLTKEDLKWRVLDIKDGQIRLISAKPTTSKVYLYGYNGYNNAVYLIDKISKTLYTTKKGTAQNLKIEDIQNVMNLDESAESNGWDYHNYWNGAGGVHYGDSETSYPGTSPICRYYPQIFKDEKFGSVDGVSGSLLELSQQTLPVDSPSMLLAEKSITFMQTSWTRVVNNSSLFLCKQYRDLLPVDYGSVYWVSSRSVSVHEFFYGNFERVCADFECCAIDEDMISSEELCDSTGDLYGCAKSIRPVITLSGGVELVSNGENTFLIKE